MTSGNILVVPLTSRDWVLNHHVYIPADRNAGLKQPSYAVTEQVRAISDLRAGRQLGKVTDEILAAMSQYLHLFIV